VIDGDGGDGDGGVGDDGGDGGSDSGGGGGNIDKDIGDSGGGGSDSGGGGGNITVADETACMVKLTFPLLRHFPLDIAEKRRGSVREW
jgi:hypothetical protein